MYVKCLLFWEFIFTVLEMYSKLFKICVCVYYQGMCEPPQNPPPSPPPLTTMHFIIFDQHFFFSSIFSILTHTKFDFSISQKHLM